MKSDSQRTTLSAAFKQRTLSLHAQAERSGIIHDLLRGQITRHGYALLLRNLLPAYQQMEKGLENKRLDLAFKELAHPGVYRTASLISDLETLCGSGWADRLPLLSAGRLYADRIGIIAKGNGVRLIAHAYVRYLGDLNGGQILKRLLSRSLELPPEALSFYEFPEIEDLSGFKIVYREALDRSADKIADIKPVIEEAATAFALNIEVSQAVRQAVGDRLFQPEAAHA